MVSYIRLAENFYLQYLRISVSICCFIQFQYTLAYICMTDKIQILQG